MKIEKAGTDQIRWIVRHRVEMLRSMGWAEEDLLKTELVVRQFLETSWTEELECYLAIEDGIVVGGCAVAVQKVLPSSRNPAGTQAYLHNMFVEPEYRRRGIATALLEHIVDVCRGRGILRLVLHATDMGRPIYERMGFEISDNYFVLVL